MEKILGILPTNDGIVYVDSEGYIKERIGIAYVEDKQYDSITEKYIGTHGYIDDLPEENTYTAILGKKGDTLTLRDLSAAFRYAEEPREVISEASKFFTINTDNLPDTIVLSFDTAVCGKYHARMDIMTKEFPYLGTKFFDLSEEDYKIKDEGNYHDKLEDVLIPVLHAYADIIGKRPNVEIYITKEDNPYFEPELLERSRKEIEHQEEMSLPRLRRFINEKLDEAMQKDEKEEKKNKAFRERIEAIRQGSLTKYDKDPNLY